MSFISDKYYICNCCKTNQKTAANLNKHLFNCKEYDNFISTKNISCNSCNLKFINKEYLINHICNIKQENIS